MNSAAMPRSSGSSARRLFQSQRSNSREAARPARTAWSTTAAAGRTASAGTCRRARVARRCTRVLDPEPAQEIRGLQRARARSRRRRSGTRPAGTAARRRGSRHGHWFAVSRRFALRRRRACAWSIRNMTRGWSTRKASTAGPPRTMQRSGRVGHDVGRRRLAEQDADLAEEVAAGERRQLLAVGDDVRLAVEDHVEAGAGEALPQHARVLREERLLEAARDADRAGVAPGRRRSPFRRSRRRSRHGSPSSPPRSRRAGRRICTFGTTCAAVDAMRARGQHRAAHRRTEEPMTLTHDRRAELLGGCPLFQGIDADGLAGLADGRDAGRLPGRARDRPPGRDRHGLLRRSSTGRSAWSATARWSRDWARASSSASCRSSIGCRATRSVAPRCRRAASRSRRGTSRRCCSSSRR